MQTFKVSLSEASFETRAVLKILVILIGLMVLASLFSQGIFLQPKNLINLVYQNAILILIALGQLLVIITGGIDLSVGATLAISSVVFVMFQNYGWPVAFLIALLVALVIGLLNGFLVTYVRLPAFVVTLAAMQICYSISKVLSGGGAIYSSPDGTEVPESLVLFYKASLWGVPYPLIVCAVFLLIIALYMLTSTGHFTHPVGGNERAAFLSGIPVRRVKMAVYVISALLCAVAGLLFVARVGMGDPQTGMWVPLDSIAAVSIGGASLSGGVGTVSGTFIGVFILSVLNNIMNLIGVPPTVQPAIKGIVILVAVYLNSTRKQN
jgi:ribose transport system permease protein